VHLKSWTHFFHYRVWISKDGIFQVNGLFYFPDQFFYFDNLEIEIFQSLFGRTDFLKNIDFCFCDEQVHFRGAQDLIQRQKQRNV